MYSMASKLIKFCIINHHILPFLKRITTYLDEATIISLFAESPSPSPSSRKATLASATVLLSQRREGKRIRDVGIFLFREKKNFCKAVTDPHSLFCFIVIAIVFSFQWSPSIRQFHDGPRRTRQRSADIGANAGG